MPDTTDNNPEPSFRSVTCTCPECARQGEGRREAAADRATDAWEVVARDGERCYVTADAVPSIVGDTIERRLEFWDTDHEILIAAFQPWVRFGMTTAPVCTCPDDDTPAKRQVWQVKLPGGQPTVTVVCDGPPVCEDHQLVFYATDGEVDGRFMEWVAAGRLGPKDTARVLAAQGFDDPAPATSGEAAAPATEPGVSESGVSGLRRLSSLSGGDLGTSVLIYPTGGMVRPVLLWMSQIRHVVSHVDNRRAVVLSGGGSHRFPGDAFCRVAYGPGGEDAILVAEEAWHATHKPGTAGADDSQAGRCGCPECVGGQS